MDKVDITIIGAGVVGLAVAAKLSEKNREILVLEKNDNFGRESSSRNSEVIHSGIYYPAQSLKAMLCIEGNKRLYKICEENNIGYGRPEKLIVADSKDETEAMEKLFENGKNNGLKDLKLLSGQEAGKLEPNLDVAAALHCPSTGIIDSHRLMQYFKSVAEEKGAMVSFSNEVTGIGKTGNEYTLTARDSSGKQFSFLTKIVINCAGLGADSIARMAGIDIHRANYKTSYCKGEYFHVNDSYRDVFTRLIYPLPAENSLGIHTVKDLQGRMKAGPNAFNVNEIDYTVDENHKKDFRDGLKRFIPSIKMEDLEPDMAGIRPQVQPDKNGFRDFIIAEESARGLPSFINLIGIESPGLTASPAIAEYVYRKIYS